MTKNDMATAPKDGSRFLVYNKRTGVMPKKGAWHVVRWFEQGWQTSSGHLITHPIAWYTLPNPPETE